jgi:ubiquinone/menaquinone biosynthesis C-methylase UbiE
MNEQASQTITEAYGTFSGKYASVLEPILKPMAVEILGLGKMVGGERLLDLATGTGLIARTTPLPKISVYGLDISLGMLFEARR